MLVEESSLWTRARGPVRDALRADVGVLLSDAEIDQITSLVAADRGGIWLHADEPGVGELTPADRWWRA
jgi:hypothetical protein